MSYLEIYNEVIRDLLVSKSKPLELREDAKSGVIQVAGLTEISTSSTNEVRISLLYMGLLCIVNKKTIAIIDRNLSSKQFRVQMPMHSRFDRYS